MSLTIRVPADPKKSAKLMRTYLDALDENPFFCRLSLDKTKWEVGRLTNRDWRTTIPLEDGFHYFARYPWREEKRAQRHYVRVVHEWAWEKFLRANMRAALHSGGPQS